MRTLCFAAIIANLLTAAAIAQEHLSTANSPEPPDKTALGYALGMRLGLQLKQAGTNLDAASAVQAARDVLEGKPTIMRESEIAPLLNTARANDADQPADKKKIGYADGMRLGLQVKRTGVPVNVQALGQGVDDVLQGRSTKLREAQIPEIFAQAEAYEAASSARRNDVSGKDFLARNAKEPGITLLPDGLQYRVLREGTGAIPSPDGLIIVKYRGTLTDGTEFDHHDRFLTRSSGGIQGWQEALQRMRIGSKWQVFLPPELGFGHEGEHFHHVGPDATLIYELELVSLASPGDLQVSTGLGHGLDASSPQVLLGTGPIGVVQGDPPATRTNVGK